MIEISQNEQKESQETKEMTPKKKKEEEYLKK
jgi:hypothetical protein